MKNIVMIGAIAFRSPSVMPIWAMTNVSTVARRGSSLGPLPAAKKFNRVKTSSLANACRIRGAPIMLPSADDNVAAKTPAVISDPVTAISRITSVSSINTAAGRVPANANAITR